MSASSFSFFVIAFLTLATRSIALDIGPMKWTLRSDWIDVKHCVALTGGPNATGDGTADDTAAIQGVLNYLQKNRYQNRLTLFFPPGTYKITATLTLSDVSGIQIIGCGSDTTIKWAGAKGGAMFWLNGTDFMRYTGLVWDGANMAGCAYEHNSAIGTYETQIRHENESFRNFTADGNYTYTVKNGTTSKVMTDTAPGSAIISGFEGSQVMGETMIYNCHFDHCTNGVVNAYKTYQNYMWHLDACEFEDCGTGANFCRGGCFVLSNCHFERSTVTDIMGGFGIHVRHCTSVGSKQFYNEGQNASLSQQVFQDCWVDGWKGPGGPIRFGSYGANTLFDCVFTHPPVGAQGIIQQDQEHALTLLSNNEANDFPKDAGIIYSRKPDTVDIVPPGAKARGLTTASQTFLKPAWLADSTHIIDITQAPYSADVSGKTECSTVIQSAIDAAKKADNGSVIYFPPGLYRMTSTLKASGGNYTIQGAGLKSELCWYGADDSTMLLVDTPQNLKVELLQFSCLSNVPGKNGYDAKLPATKAASISAIKETSTGPSSAIYDDVSYYAFFASSPGAMQDNMIGQGLVLSKLPAGAKVYLPHVVTPLTVDDCGPARIYSMFLQMGAVRVSGTAAKTGFFGALVAEGGQQPDLNGANIVVNDNQDLVFGDYYSEQCRNDLRISRGAGTTEGRVTIQGWVSAAGENSGEGNASTTAISVDNYTGRLFYGPQAFSNNTSKSPVQFTHTGSNAFDFILCADTYDGGQPVIKLGSGANLIQTLSQLSSQTGNTHMPEIPNPLSAAALASMAKSLDHLRELEAIDLEFEFGLGGQK